MTGQGVPVLAVVPEIYGALVKKHESFNEQFDGQHFNSPNSLMRNDSDFSTKLALGHLTYDVSKSLVQPDGTTYLMQPDHSDATKKQPLT